MRLTQSNLWKCKCKFETETKVNQTMIEYEIQPTPKSTYGGSSKVGPPVPIDRNS